MRREWCCQARCLIDWFTGRVNDIAIGNIHEKRIATCQSTSEILCQFYCTCGTFRKKLNLHKTSIWKISRKTQFPFQPIFNNLKMAYFFLIFSILSISTSPRHPARHLWMSDLKRFQRQWCAKEIPIIITPTLYAMMDRLSFVDFAIYTWKWSKKFVDLWRVIPPLITFEINAHSTHPESVVHVCHLTRNLISPRAVYEPHSISTSSSNFTTSAAGNEDQRQQNWIQLQTYWYISLTICERRCFSSSIGNSEYLKWQME